MDPHFHQWISLLIRWLHIIAGIAWIGSSFYFNWLDGNLRKPEREEDAEGLAGELWSVHGGGFYVVQKFQVAPERLPKTLHWIKWEAYTTWISGFFLLGFVYYMGGRAYLIDVDQSPVSFGAAVGIGLGSLAVGWIIYHLLADTPLVRVPLAFAAVGFALATAAAFGLLQVFTNRAAFIHMGAIIGTIMAANVFFVIIPGQRKLVDALRAGKEPDAASGARAKQRSLHNNYMTLPVLFIMISNHYPHTFEHQFNWIVLAAISLIGAGTRHWFNLRNQGRQNRWLLPAAALAMLALVMASKPKASNTAGQVVAYSEVWNVISQRCSTCHSANPTDDIFKSAPNGVIFDTGEQIKAYAPQIKQRSVLTQSMPLGNKTKMTPAERELLGRWIAQGAPIE